MTETVKSEKSSNASPQRLFHSQKHDLSLSFEPKTYFNADQTPTPTGILRKCEDLGLFQDLQSLNPFDDTFHRAHIEIISTGTIPVPANKPNNDDSLHTPQVFPVENTQQSSFGSIKPTPEKIRKRPGRKSNKVKELERKLLEVKVAEGRKSLLPKLLPSSIINLPVMNSSNPGLVSVKAHPQIISSNPIITPNGILYPVQQVPIVNATSSKTATISKLTAKIAKSQAVKSAVNTSKSNSIIISNHLVNSNTNHQLVNSISNANIVTLSTTPITVSAPVNGTPGVFQNVQVLSNVAVIPQIESISTPTNKITITKPLLSSSRAEPTTSEPVTAKEKKLPDADNLRVKNKYASKLARLKRKRYMQELQSQNELMHRLNRRYLAENMKLKTEVCELKELIMKHQGSCSSFKLDSNTTGQNNQEVKQIKATNRLEIQESNMDMLLDVSTKSTKIVQLSDGSKLLFSNQS